MRFISHLLHHGMTHLLPHTLYRTYLKNLRHIPDPQVWRTHQPYFRSLVDRPKGLVLSPTRQDDAGLSTGETPTLAEKPEYAKEARRLRGLTRAKEELKKLRAATACHPHAFRRLLEESYGRRGRVRWELINNVLKSSPTPPASASAPPSADPPLPPPLYPLKPALTPIRDTARRLRLRPIPDVAVRKAAHEASERDWREVAVPLTLPLNPEGWKTGWEDLGVIESLRILAGLDIPIPSKQPSDIADTAQLPSSIPTLYPLRPLSRTLPTYAHLPAHIRLLIPKHQPTPPSRDETLTYPRPRPGETRQNPRTWGPPRLLRARLIRRSYLRLWKSLRWVKMGKNGDWLERRYEALVDEDDGVEIKRTGGMKGRRARGGKELGAK